MAIYGSVGALVARSSPRNPIGWLLAWVGLAVALWMFGLAYAQIGLDPGEWIGDLPGATAAAWIGVLALPAATPVVLPLFLLFFPDGRLRSPRWRPVLWITCLGGCLMLFGALWIPWDADPIRLDQLLGSGQPPILFVGFLVVLLSSFAGVLALVLRFREADPERRQPLRLLVGVLVAMAVATAVAIALNLVPDMPEWLWFPFLLAIIVDGIGVLFGIPLAAAAAVLTFGLYDVGVVVKKTVVYVAVIAIFLVVLTLFALVLNPLNLLGSGVDASRTEAAVMRIVAIGSLTLLVLVLAFRPVKHLARRLVYGRRSTPYEAMTEFSERLGEAYSTHDVLPRMASILQASTGAAVARVWLHVGRELRPVAVAPQGIEDPAPLAVIGDEPAAPEGSRIFLVRDRGELLGALTVTMPPAEPLSKTGEQLVADVASQAGLVLRNVRLVEELQESRRRIVAAQDERARKLERDLHDGAQQQLVALSVKQRLASSFVGRDDERARAMLDELQAETADALESLRDLARGIYPPLLADKGLVAALEAQTRKVAVATSVDGDGIGRFAQEIETAVYFCCLEAIQNAAKYASAEHVRISLAASNGDLTFVIGDDGAGFDAGTTARGAGLTNMRDRIEALGGAFEIESAPGRGTDVRGRIPIGSKP
jgi:signal transduction histidine kinase